MRSVKGKVLIAFLAGCVALGLAWGFSRVAFREMMSRVEQLSAPDERLQMVNELFLGITQLSQSQRTQALLKSGNSFHSVSEESEPLIAKLDSLRLFYSSSPGQVNRIDSMKDILQERDKLFANYLKVRSGLISGEVLADQMQSLSGLISNTASKIDSTVITTEKKVSTMTVYPDDSIQLKKPESEQKLAEETSSGLLGRIFGKKKEVEEAMSGSHHPDTALQPRRIIEEVIDIRIDTLALAKQDSLIQTVEQLMNDIREDQRRRSARFVNREIELLNAGNMLVNEMLSILQEMEQEALRENAISNAQARQVIHESVRRVVITMLVFFLITGVLVYLILTDIARSSTYQRQLEEAKEEAEYHSMAKQRFLSNMSHELRTPLQTIIGYADLLRQQHPPSREGIEAIYRSSGHLLQVVNEVLDYNRIISGKFTFSQRPVNVRELLGEVIAAMRGQAMEKSLELEAHIDLRGSQRILADPFRLKQILYNLLGNAIKFTERGKVNLTVTDEQRGKRTRLIFRVADTGVGIASEDISRIFQQYEQGGSESKQPGTGLGLNIVHILTSKMGGTIHVESEPGKGSVFTVHLGFETAAAAEPAPVENPALPAERYGKVWVVDDDQLILEWCRAVFRKNGIRHECFQLPGDVIEADWDDRVNIVLLDIRMPGMSGLELCRWLRKRVPTHVKVIALTAQALPDEQEAVVSQGFDGILMKPFRESELLKLLEDAARNAPPHDVTDSAYVKPAEPEAPGAASGPAPLIDLSLLNAMTYGDREQIRKILDRFVEDTGSDIDQIYHSIELSDREKLLLLLHRMAGRTAQIGARDLAAQFRTTELSLRQNASLEDTHKEEINSLMKELAALVKNIPAN